MDGTGGFGDEAEYRAYRRKANRRALIFLIAMSPIVVLLLLVFLAAVSIVHAPIFF